jgi:hypothetical protein
MSDSKEPIDSQLGSHLEREDPLALSRHATIEELQRLNAAEDVIEKRHQRRRRTARFAAFAQSLVGYVALAGFFANAYQNWTSKRQADARARTDEERWGKEFKRAQDADKYRAFFETAALATDQTNRDKRLVGYALLKEFVDDRDYNSKATFLLEESLALELRDDDGPGLDEPHRAAVVAILSALGHTSDCRSLARAARTVEKLAVSHARKKDLVESREVLGLYVVRLVGRAAAVCNAAEVLEVRQPIANVIGRIPEMATLTGKPKPADIDRRIVAIIRERCHEETAAGSYDCSNLDTAWKHLCGELGALKSGQGAALCDESHPAAAAN